MQALFRPLLAALLMLPAGCMPPVTSPGPLPSAPTPPAPVSAPPSIAPTPSTPAPAASPIAFDFAGSWLLDAPAESGVPSSDACDQYAVGLERMGDTIRLRRFTGEPFVEEEAVGPLEGDRLILHGTALVGLVSQPVAYELTLDQAAGTLQGTRDGLPVTLRRWTAGVCQTNMPTVAVRGWVYDTQGHPVSGATVTFRSTNPSNPFELSVTAENGSYAAYRVPAGVNMVVRATKAGVGSQTRERSFTWHKQPGWTRLHFGGRAATEDWEAAQYPLLPEPSPSP